MKPTFEQIKQAKEILKNAGYIGIDSLFSDIDIVGRCNDLNIEEPNQDQIKLIISNIDRRFDSTLGINYDTIDSAIEDVINPSIDDNVMNGKYDDLFESYKDQPKELQEILEKYNLDDADYITLQQMLKEVESVGYTFDYGLDCEPFALRFITVKLSEVKGYEDCED